MDKLRELIAGLRDRPPLSQEEIDRALRLAKERAQAWRYVGATMKRLDGIEAAFIKGQEDHDQGRVDLSDIRARKFSAKFGVLDGLDAMADRLDPGRPRRPRPPDLSICQRKVSSKQCLSQVRPRHGRAPRRGCNQRRHGSRRASGIRTGQDPGDPHLEPDHPAARHHRSDRSEVVA